jgi:TRAP-type C4-dicarboxylate transport system substrate-binding protein
MTMNRRDVLTGGLAAGVAIGAFGIPGVAHAATKFTGVTYLPPSYTALMWGINGFNERLGKALGDSGELDFHDSGTLMKADEQLAALRSRVIDYMFHTSTYITRSFKAIGLVGLPSLVGELYEHGDRIARGSPLFELMRDEMRKDNIETLTLGGGVIEPQYVWSAKEPITSLDQLSGRKVRVVGYEASTALEKIGVVPVRIPSSETYLALQRGTVDAVVANISTVVARNLQEQLKYCYRLPITAYTIGIYMLADRYDQLDDKTRAAFDSTSDWYDQNYAKQVNTVLYKRDHWPKIEAAGIEITTPEKADSDRFTELSREVWEWWKGEVGAEHGDRAIKLALGEKA